MGDLNFILEYSSAQLFSKTLGWRPPPGERGPMVALTQPGEHGSMVALTQPGGRGSKVALTQPGGRGSKVAMPSSGERGHHLLPSQESLLVEDSQSSSS